MESTEQIRFEVSAKTARLIGRENISELDGALIELVKNAYDADADCVAIKFVTPFPTVSKTISSLLVNKWMTQEETAELLKYYEMNGANLTKKENLSETDHHNLQSLLFSKNTVIIADNGHGMSRDVLRQAWMNIGTSDKELNQESPKGRVKTGAKGIGRFALDKLSRKTKVFTKSALDAQMEWKIDWDQFENATYLHEVAATMIATSGDYRQTLHEYFGETFAKLENRNWDTGTMIILSPTREPWSNEIIKRINANLRTSYPQRADDIFDLFVEYSYNADYNYDSTTPVLDDNDYDYRIGVDFDGIDTLNISLLRNEVDIRKNDLYLPYCKSYHSADDFWRREALQRDRYRREDYGKEILFNETNLQMLLKSDKDMLSQLGPVSATLFFVKPAKSPARYDIIKTLSTAKRRKVLKEQQGIKIYRDHFKVRPYGEPGTSAEDWLGLGKRALSSPASVAHDDERWRVTPYQMIGVVNITRNDNPLLVDTANREGLAANDAYNALVDLLLYCISVFETDRRLFYKEYSKWYKQREDEYQRASIASSASDDKPHESNDENENQDRSEQFLSEKRKVQYLESAREREERTNRTMMMFSSAGVITNTFSHELRGIRSNMGSRNQHLRAALRRLIGEEGYTGDPDYDPFVIVNENESIDMLMDDWINVIMDGVSNEKSVQRDIELNASVARIAALWTPLLKKKHIRVEMIACEDDITISMAEIDLYIVLNNVFLNSSWFLEKSSNVNRIIRIRIEKGEANDYVRVYLENNGPPLAEQYRSNPNQILEPGVSSKENGTGIGLWIADEVIAKNNGQLFTVDREDGFELIWTISL